MGFAATVNEMNVSAYSEDHAERIASALAGVHLARVMDAKQMKKPREAKTCKTEDFPVKGTRKWKTVYNVYAYGNKIPVGRDKYKYTNMEFVQGGFDTKTEAVKVAREMAIKHQLPMTVQIAKELEEGSPHVTDVEPKTTAGEFRVKFMV